MNCLSKLNYYIIPNDVVVKLTNVYRNIGNNEFYINSLGSDLSKVVEKTVATDCIYLSKMLNFDITDARLRLLVKGSAPKNKLEKTLLRAKEVLNTIQNSDNSLSLKSNDLLNIVNYLYPDKTKIVFNNQDDYSQSNFVKNQIKSKKLILDEMDEIVNEHIKNNTYDKIILSIHYFIDLYNLKPFNVNNDLLTYIVLYQLVLNSGLNAFKYVSFFECLYNDYDNFKEEISKASVNWNEQYSQTIEFVKYFLSLIDDAYKSTDQIIKNYKFDRVNKKFENVETTILSFTTTFTKEDVREMNPYVSESTINRTLYNLKELGLIDSLGKGRSARWIKK